MKRVLIITYYWPPSAGSGVQRWLKFAKYLPEYGWEPVIFTPENPDFELKDPSLINEIPVGLEVLKFPIWEPYQILRFLKKGKIRDTSVILEGKNKSMLDRLAIWLRANFLIPDPRVFWIKPSVKFLTENFNANDFKAVITTGPPHSMHLIGRNLKREKNLPWIADFRDPWSAWEFLDTLPLSAKAKAAHKKLERTIFTEADELVTISPTFKKEMEILAKRKVNLITNGYDPSDLPEGFKFIPQSSDVFEVVYSGVIDAIRDPIPFLNALKKAFSKKNHEIRCTFVGKVSHKMKGFVNQDNWLKAHVHFAGYVSHKEVFEFYEKTHLLLLILTNTKNAKGNIPGKLFEYMATGRPILALGDPDGDSAAIIREAKAGEVFLHESVESIQDYLMELYQRRDQVGQQKNIQQYTRLALTRQLAEILDKNQ
ncbi:MAG: glycosyltransferase family 4 protein [Cyclobacteriaceae bacterium]